MGVNSATNEQWEGIIIVLLLIANSIGQVRSKTNQQRAAS